MVTFVPGQLWKDHILSTVRSFSGDFCS
uniref:Uncharacterized protein n=1 Tax=Anguilla anguilla TaxID=7936 RepID=A0A0E9STL0_ANGAN